MGATTHKRMVSSRARGPSTFTPHPAAEQPRSRAELYAAGKALRTDCPRVAHAAWKAPGTRRDAVDMVLEAEKGRMPELLPLRHGRMVRSAFTFYRGSALTMAADLASTPASGIRVQCCGDAHLSNFGGFATPERRILFSINDLDETLPAPWEWDVKRLAASFVVACRDNGLGDGVAQERGHDLRPRLPRVDGRVQPDEDARAVVPGACGRRNWWRASRTPSFRKRAIDTHAEGAREEHRGEDMFPKLVEHKGDMPVIKDQLPTIFHLEGHPPGEIQQALRDALAVYRASLPLPTRSLLDRYELRDAAIKVVGIGSVGTALLGVPVHGRRRRPPLPPDQGGARLGAGAVRRRERVPEPRAARGGRLPASCSRPATCSSGGAWPEA